jgi:hypothetical protein
LIRSKDETTSRAGKSGTKMGSSGNVLFRTVTTVAHWTQSFTPIYNTLFQELAGAVRGLGEKGDPVPIMNTPNTSVSLV